MFLLDRIAEREQVSVTEQELVGRLWELSRRWKKDPAEARRLLDQQGLWPSVLSTLRREKTMAIIKGAAVIEEEAAATPRPS
jgi:FKBP-type peptidyl-prolyl cis-trans isomerase (trigger factor)